MKESEVERGKRNAVGGREKKLKKCTIATIPYTTVAIGNLKLKI